MKRGTRTQAVLLEASPIRDCANGTKNTGGLAFMAFKPLPRAGCFCIRCSPPSRHRHGIIQAGQITPGGWRLRRFRLYHRPGATAAAAVLLHRHRQTTDSRLVGGKRRGGGALPFSVLLPPPPSSKPPSTVWFAIGHACRSNSYH